MVYVPQAVTSTFILCSVEQRYLYLGWIQEKNGLFLYTVTLLLLNTTQSMTQMLKEVYVWPFVWKGRLVCRYEASPWCHLAQSYNNKGEKRSPDTLEILLYFVKKYEDDLQWDTP